MKNEKYKLISKTLFFPKEGILAVGDLHIGYDKALHEQGITIPFNQLEQTKKELKEIIEKIQKKNQIKKIVLLGDIKHYFGFQKSELFDVKDFLKFDLARRIDQAGHLGKEKRRNAMRIHRTMITRGR